jgi:hypothetical protein
MSRQIKINEKNKPKIRVSNVREAIKIPLSQKSSSFLDRAFNDDRRHVPAANKSYIINKKAKPNPWQNEKIQQSFPQIIQNKIKLNSSTKSLIVKYIAMAFLSHLVSKNLLELAIRHVFYLSQIGFFHAEFFFIAFYGLINTFFILVILLSYFVKIESVEKRPDLVIHYLLCLFASSLVISITQFCNQMSFWEHKYNLHDFAVYDISRCVVELILYLVVLLSRIY